MLSTTMAPLGQFQRWINWTLEHDPKRPEKPRKVPRSPITGEKVGATDQAAWSTYEVARAAAVARGHGLGYVFHEGDNLFFLDIDNCVDEATGRWSQIAQNLMEIWKGQAAIEVSQSGKGLHIIGHASSIPPHGCKNVLLGLELYHTGRFMAFTDNQSFGTIGADLSPTLAGVVAAYFPKTASSSEVVDWCDEGDGAEADDNKLLDIMLRSGLKTAAATFKADHVPFKSLWHAEAEVLSKAFPSQNGYDAWDKSHADSALASHLVYWCGGNLERVLAFMRRSGLVRDKWDDRPNYLETTIITAAQVVRTRAGPREVGAPLLVGSAPATSPAQAPGATPPPNPELAHLSTTVAVSTMSGRTGAALLSYDEQRKYFSGCVYIVAPNQVWHPKIPLLMDKPRFEILFGGRSFALTDEKNTKSAWEAFTMSHGIAPVTAINTCFRPHLPGGTITSDNLLNTYQPVETTQIAGDPGPFIEHLKKLFPHGDDFLIIVAFMARVIRSPGFKAQWWPVIQGCQGNGKTILNLIMMFCIGYQYSHQARASALAKSGMQFNAWVTGKLYLGIEEIQVSDKRHFLEDFKDIVTNTTAAIEAKGKDQMTGDNFLNGMMFTNHRDAVPVTEEDRRYAIFYTAQQGVIDLARDGMGAAYFTNLYDWLYGRGAYAALGADYGFAVVNHWLRHEAQIDARYDPAGICQRAPSTSAMPMALVESRGSLEQDLLEKVANGEQGFNGGWVGAAELDVLLTAHRLRLPHTKRHQLMDRLGYTRHPALPDGRTTRPVGGKGRMVVYLRKDHTALALQDPEAVTTGYERAQSYAVNGNAAAAAMVR